MAGLLIATLFTAAAAAAPLKVAVLDLEATGVEKEVARNISDLFVTVISDLGCCKVISRTEISAMLGFEKQKQLLGCSADSSCMAEIGGALGVDKIAVGNVGRVGKTFMLTLRLIDMNTANVDARYTDRVTGEVDALLDLVEKGVHRIFDPVLAARTPAPSPSPPAVAVAPSPPAHPATPATAAPPAPDKPSSPPPAPVEAVQPPAVGQRIALVAEPVEVRLESAPPGATISVGGKASGAAPVKVALLPGRHRVRAELAGKGAVDEEIEVKPGEPLARRLELPVRLTVATEPSGAAIALDDRKIGAAPLEAEVRPGAHRIVAEMEKYLPKGQDFAAEPGGELSLSLKLKPEPRPKIWTWLSLGLGAAAGATGGGLGLWAQSIKARDTVAGGVHSLTEAEALQVNAIVLGANVAFALAGTLALGGGVLFFVESREEP